METWILLAVAAAGFQSARFALQKSVASVGPSGVAASTFARFLWAAPLAALMLVGLVLMTEEAAPRPNVAFLSWGVLGGVSQILATLLVVSLFRIRDFAVGIALKKTEVLITALVGFVLIGDALGPFALIALVVGFLGVMLLSDARPADWRPGPALWVGLASGAAFALSAVGYRAATLTLEGPWEMRAITTLAWVTAGQAVGMAIWLRLFRPGVTGDVVRAWRRTAPVGITSALGSACWFGAFSLQSAALVFAVGQVELIFSLVLGRVLFAEAPARRAIIGIVLIGVSVVAIALA